ncbi:MAG: hypothetical protein O9283_10120 [Sphingomonadaceae bacterium]|nr:hypothetical protein [Sphingomonadaceae bacterium]
MEFARNLFVGQNARLDPDLAPAGAPQCDWHSLSARLQAAHAARLALRQVEVDSLRRLGGSFGSGAVTVVGVASYGSRPVNPTDLADGKAPEGKTDAAAAHFAHDGRG